MVLQGEAQSSGAKVFAFVCVLIILSVGGVLFLIFNARSKSRAATPKTRAGGYQKLSTKENTAPQPASSSFGEYNDRIIDGDDDEEEEDDDIVYMTQDGTVYKKFKYGLLDQDDIELEYDDESYSYRWRERTGMVLRLMFILQLCCAMPFFVKVETDQSC